LHAIALGALIGDITMPSTKTAAAPNRRGNRVPAAQVAFAKKAAEQKRKSEQTASKPSLVESRKPTRAEQAKLNAVHTRRHHLDRRAHALVLEEGSDDDLLNTQEVAAWLGVSIQFLEIGRHQGYGPRYVKIAQRLVRYRRGEVRAWLTKRTRQSTSEYAEA
jgi:predicted DNA-binding transcriptional regulator AlpA